MKQFFAAGLTAIFAGTLLLIPMNAEAIPAFARKFQTTCDVCHRGGFPQLTEHGEEFKERGLQNKSGGEYDGGTKGKSELDDKVIVEKSIYPLSFRVISDIKHTPNSGTANTPEKKSKLSFEIPHELELILGGTLFKNISYWTEIVWEGGGTDIELINFSFNNITGDNSLNVRAGLFGINDWAMPGHRLLQKKMEIEGLAVAGDDGWTFGNPETGLEVYGRPADGPLFYNVGLTNGAKGFGNNGSDTNSAKNVFGRLGINAGGQEFGIQGYRGKNARASTTTTDYFEENQFNRIGFDTILRFGDLQIYGLYLLGHDDNPTYGYNANLIASDSAPVQSVGYFVNASYVINDMLMGVVQFDYNKKTHVNQIVLDTSNKDGDRTSDQKSLEIFLTPGIVYTPIQNFRTVVEYQFDLKKRDTIHSILEDRFNVRLDFTF